MVLGVIRDPQEILPLRSSHGDRGRFDYIINY